MLCQAAEKKMEKKAKLNSGSIAIEGIRKKKPMRFCCAIYRERECVWFLIYQHFKIAKMAVRPIGIWVLFKARTHLYRMRTKWDTVFVEVCFSLFKTTMAVTLTLTLNFSHRTKTFPRPNCVNNTSRNRCADVALAQLKNIRTLGVCCECVLFLFLV